MGLSGNFRETSFADLLQFYSVSKQTVAVTVRLGSGEHVDGVFYFADGDLVGASLGEADGREAVRRALRLRDGLFTVDAGVRPADAPTRETLRSVVMEEVVRLDEENRRAPRAATAAPKHTGAVAAGATWFAAPDAAVRPAPVAPRTAAPRPPPVPASHSTTGSVPRPAARSAPAAAPRASAASAAPGSAPAPTPLPTPTPAPAPAAAPPAGSAARGPAATAAPAWAASQATTGPIPRATAEATSQTTTGPIPRATAEAASQTTTGPIPRAEAASAGAPAPKPSPPASAPRRPPPAPPAPPRGGRHGIGVLVAIAMAAVLVLGGVAWYVLARGPAGEVVAPAAVATGPRGVLDDTLVLGMVASFTGSNKERGRAMRVGWDTAIAEANEAGGVHGRRLRLVVLDDGYDPARTGPAMKDVVEGQGAFAIVGNVGTATAAVAVPYCAEKDCVFFGALSGADLLRKNPPDRHVFNFRAGLAAEAAAAVRYLVDVRRLSPRRIATLAQEDDFGASGQRGALKQLATYGVAEADVLKLGYPRNTADVRDAIARLRERIADVDAVVMVATYKPAATFIRKTRDAGLKLAYTTVSADSNGLAEELVVSGQGYTEDVLLTQVVPVPTSPATTLIRYRKALEKYAPGEKPGSTSLEAWIGAQIFLEALRRAGRDLDTQAVVAALEGIRDWDLGIGGPISFGPADHQGSDMVFGWLLQPDGAYKQVELE